jgi:hypothetical protein
MAEFTHGLTEVELETVISKVSMESYRRAADWDKPKILEWVPKLQEMSDEDFVTECTLRILDSAIMNGRRDAWGTHARADICADEAMRRHRAAGHDDECRGENLYSEGYNQALKSQGHAVQPPTPCTCGHKEK